MALIAIKVMDKDGYTKSVSRGEDFVSLVHTMAYVEGDHIDLEISGREKGLFLHVQFDDALGSSLCYLTGSVCYEIPFGEKRISYSPKAFMGDMHYLFARVAREDEISAYRNMCFNINDQHGDTNCYPHAYANVETRGESVFAARNAIDGICINTSHGAWPYESWGINRREDAYMVVDFGREVEIDKLVLYTRADFPHDAWWRQATVEFSDGTYLVWDMEKSTLPHVKEIEPKKITSLKLCNLIKADDPSPFPALTQIEAYGHEVIG